MVIACTTIGPRDDGNYYPRVLAPATTATTLFLSSSSPVVANEREIEWEWEWEREKKKTYASVLIVSGLFFVGRCAKRLFSFRHRSSLDVDKTTRQLTPPPRRAVQAIFISSPVLSAGVVCVTYTRTGSISSPTPPSSTGTAPSAGEITWRPNNNIMPAVFSYFLIAAADMSKYVRLPPPRPSGRPTPS